MAEILDFSPESEGPKEIPEREVFTPDKWIEVKPIAVYSEKEKKENGIEEATKYLEEGEPKPLPSISIPKNCEKDFTVNNGVVVAVTSNLEVFIAPATDDRREMLEKAGYQQSPNLTVPFSNDEKFADKDLETKWEEMREQARKESSPDEEGGGE